MGVVYMGRERVDRTRYDTIMDWLKGRIQDVQQRGCRIILGGRETLIRNEEQCIKGNKEEINENGRRVLE